jgi:hypothetical protein
MGVKKGTGRGIVVTALLEYEKARVVAIERALDTREEEDRAWLDQEMDSAVRNTIRMLESPNLWPSADPADKKKWLAQARPLIGIIDANIALSAIISSLAKKLGVSAEALEELSRATRQVESNRERLIHEVAVLASWVEDRTGLRYLLLSILFFTAATVLCVGTEAAGWPSGLGFAGLLWLGSFGFFTLFVSRSANLPMRWVRVLDLARRYVANEDPPSAA